jgi:dihydroorotase
MTPLFLYRNLQSVGFHDNSIVDVLTDGHTIIGIGNALAKPKNAQEINIENAFISPGFIDLRCQSGEPGHEENETFLTLAQSAKAGGFTTLHILPNTLPVVDNAQMVQFIQHASIQNICNFLPIGSITRSGLGTHLSDMMEMNQAGTHLFAEADSIYNADILLKALQYSKMFDVTIIDRPEEKSTALFGQIHEGFISNTMGMKGIPSLSEILAVKRDIEILRYSGGKLHLSCISTKEAVEEIKKAKAEGLNITADVSAHQLIYTDQNLTTFDTNYKVNPPFRTEEDRLALIEGLENGTIDAIVSNHTPINIDGKQLEFDAASFGISSLPLIFHYALKALNKNIENLVRNLATNPAKISGLPISKLEHDATNFTIFSTSGSTQFTHQNWPSLSANQPALNQTFEGKIIATII